jgi:t-SNARE complex subunit (syntaxin)
MAAMTANLNKLIVRLEDFSSHGMDFVRQLEEAIFLYIGTYYIHNGRKRIRNARLRAAYELFFDGYPLHQKEQRFQLAEELRRLYSLAEPSE